MKRKNGLLATASFWLEIAHLMMYHRTTVYERNASDSTR